MRSGAMWRYGTRLVLLAWLAATAHQLQAEQKSLSDGVSGDGHMEMRGDQYGAFGPFSINDPGIGNYDPNGAVGLRPWLFWSGLMLTNGTDFQWLMDADDWPGDFGGRMLDTELVSDVPTNSTRTSSFNVSLLGDLRVDLVQEV